MKSKISLYEERVFLVYSVFAIAKFKHSINTI